MFNFFSLAQKLKLKRLKFDGHKRRPILPNFGKKRKRSIEEQIEEEEQRLFLEYHRRTRQILYKKIEKYVNS